MKSKSRNVQIVYLSWDKDNKVMALGNPIHNPKVKELYIEVLQVANRRNRKYR